MKIYLAILTILGVLMVALSYKPPQFTGYLILNNIQNLTMEPTLENAEKAINNSEIMIQTLIEDGFSTSFFSDTLIKSKELFNKTVYDLVLQKYQEIINRKERAYSIRDNLRALEIRIREVSDKKLDVKEAVAIFEKAKTEFSNERYDRVEQLILEGNKKLNDIESESRTIGAMLSAAKDNFIEYIKNVWQYVLAVLIILTIIGFFVIKKYQRIRTRNQIEDLKIENDVIAKQTKKTQMDYFETKKISKQSYDVRMGEYQKRLNEIKEKLPVLQKRFGRVKKLPIRKK